MGVTVILVSGQIVTGQLARTNIAYSDKPRSASARSRSK
jgi:hypothetical protein